MERCLFVLLLFSGVAPFFLSVPRRYYLIQQGKTWSDAQAYCQAEHTDLAIVRNNADLIQIQNEAQRQQFSSSAWIGLYLNVSYWFWSMGNEALGSMRPWGNLQPDNWQGNEACGALQGTQWADRPCTDQTPFLCFDGTKTGNQRYISISTPKTWSEAQSYCRTYHTDLASSRDATENSVIGGFASGGTWFGLFRHIWMWTDQTNFSTLSWMTGQPDNAQVNENCGYLNNIQVADALCSDIKPSFCYSVITGKLLVMKVKVQSSQDMNGLAVKVAMLERIKQKIKDLVMGVNITVKWREQPDGSVFHKEKENNGT